MNPVMLLLLVLLAAATTAVTAENGTEKPAVDCGRFLNFKVWFGNRTEPDDYPWIALLEYETPQGQFVSCGGVLLNQRYVLTAGHCAAYLGSNWTLVSVRLGEYDTNTKVDCIPEGDAANSTWCLPEALSVKIDRVITHEKYGDEGRAHDLALIRLAENVQFSRFVQPICLPTKEPIPQKYHVSGYGRLAGRRGSNLKLHSSLSLFNATECRAWYNRAKVNLGDDQFCAGSQNGSEKPCIGDSGGPLMGIERGSDGIDRMTVFGVLSMDSRFCDVSGWPGVYVDVMNYTNWIRENMKA